MYDTIQLGFPIVPSVKQLEQWDEDSGKNKLDRKTGIRKTTIKYETWLRWAKGSIHVIYYPQDKSNRQIPLLLFEMSLPKLVYGDNIHMISIPNLAIERANQIIKQNQLVPVVDLNRGILYRLDLCYNFLVGGTVSEWIDQLFKLEYPRRKTKPYYPSEGVQYYSGKTSLSFYDKEAETRNDAAYGILRMEASWRNKNRIGELVGKPMAMIGDFPSEVVSSLLDAELDKLGIKDRAPVDSKATLRTLLKVYEPEQGLRLYGFMNAMQNASSDEMKAMGMTKQTISRNRKAVHNVGLSMCIAENEIALPQLVIPPKGIVEWD